MAETHAYLRRVFGSATTVAALFGVALLTIVTPLSAQTIQPPQDAPPTTRIDSGPLHGQYFGGHVWQGGVFNPLGSAPPGAHLTYYGGRVISNAQVVQVIWGTGSYLAEVTSTASPSMPTFFQGVLNSPYIDWLTEYNTRLSGGTNQTIGRGSFVGQFMITPLPAHNGTTIDDTAIQAELDAQISAGHLPAPTHDAAGNTNTVYMVYFPHGKTITLGGEPSCVGQNFCAYHSTIQSGTNGEYYYGVFPDMQAGSGCETHCGSAATPFGNYTSTASHELIESITDAEAGLAPVVGPPLAWYDENNGEIGDICNKQQGTIEGGDGVTYVVQKQFSNVANNCIISVRSLTQQGPKLVGTDAAGNAEQGFSVSLSADGNTAMVGGLFDDSDAGAAWVWTRSARVWTRQGPKLIGSDAVGDAQQGRSVSLSADGNTAIVGGSGDNGFVGAAWVWTRSGGAWTQQGPKLVASDAVGQAEQGGSVSLSADGNTAVVGGAGDNNNTGAAWVWTRNGGVWTQQGPKLVGSGAVGGAPQGSAVVSLSADGNTAIVGRAFDNGLIGAAWVWARSGGVWTQQGPKLVGSGAAGNAEQGFSVSLSADGNTAMVGGFGDNGLAGATWVWTRSGGAWTQQGPKLVGSDAVGVSVRQGYSVSLSADGNTAVIGGIGDSNNTGAAWVWTRSGGVWTQQGPKLVGSGAVGNPVYQGISVSLSSDGNKAIVGGAGDNGFVGAAWVYAAPAPALTGLSPSKTWIGLKNGDDVGIRFDLLSRVYLSGVLVGSGQINSVVGGSNGFNNAKLNTIPLTLTEPVDVSTGDTLSIELLVRNACSSSGKNSGVARLWYNGQPIDSGTARTAGSRFDATIGGTSTDYFLRGNSALSTTAGTSQLSVDKAVGSRCSAFVSIGSWTTPPLP